MKSNNVIFSLMVNEMYIIATVYYGVDVSIFSIRGKEQLFPVRVSNEMSYPMKS